MVVYTYRDSFNVQSICYRNGEFCFRIFCLRFFYLKDGVKYIISFSIIGLLLVWIIAEIGYFENIESMLIGKKDSFSGIQRGAAAYLTWEVFYKHGE